MFVKTKTKTKPNEMRSQLFGRLPIEKALLALSIRLIFGKKTLPNTLNAIR